MPGKPPRTEILLPSNALQNVRLGISVSDSPDLSRLGLLEKHFRLALGEIARCVLVSGGQVTYGGHLDPGGYTAFLVQELYRYGRRNRPLHICLAWQEHRKISMIALKQNEKLLGLYGDITYLDPDGEEIDPFADRSEEPILETNDTVRKRSLTALRHYMAEHTQGRIFIGGQRSGFQGALPGLMEEAIIALRAGQPVYLAGGFGGVTLDILKALGVDDGDWFPEKSDVSEPDGRWTKGIEILTDLKKEASWKGLQNGLSEDENRKHAATHRPSEIATLIALGLGRQFAAS